MKKTLNINLNGQAFCIDEDACQKLQAYIETLENHYLKEEDGKEIMADIESRIAELLNEALQQTTKNVVSLSEIESVIDIMGAPDAIIDEDTENPTTETIKKKLYRDPDHQVLGGVASGIAAYLDISIAWIRIAFVALAFFYGITILVYIILWIAMPMAITSKQKMEMKGERMNVSNIEKNIRNTYDHVKKNSNLQGYLKKTGNGISAFFGFCGELIRNIFSTAANILSILGILVGTFLILFFCWLILFPTHFTPDYYYAFFQHTISPLPMWLLKIILLLLINIPLFLIVYYSIRHFFRIENNKPVFLISGSTWVVVCFAGIFLCIYQTMQYSQEYQSQNTQALVPAGNVSQQLNVKFHRLQEPKSSGIINCSLNSYLLYTTNSKDSALYLQPHILLESTSETTPILTIEKKARGLSSMDALKNTDHILYRYEWKNDTLCLDSYFTLNQPQWRVQDVLLTIGIPENYKLNLQNPPRRMFHNLGIFEDWLRSPQSTQIYQMTDGQLKKIESNSKL